MGLDLTVNGCRRCEEVGEGDDNTSVSKDNRILRIGDDTGKEDTGKEDSVSGDSIRLGEEASSGEQSPECLVESAFPCPSITGLVEVALAMARVEDALTDSRDRFEFSLLNLTCRLIVRSSSLSSSLCRSMPTHLSTLVEIFDDDFFLERFFFFSSLDLRFSVLHSSRSTGSLFVSIIICILFV